jgi:hypothetical protein
MSASAELGKGERLPVEVLRESGDDVRYKSDVAFDMYSASAPNLLLMMKAGS